MPFGLLPSKAMARPRRRARQFDVDQPNVAWVGDITYLWTQEGWLYLAVLLDLYSRKVVGWAMRAHVDTE
jgi:putative transposase